MDINELILNGVLVDLPANFSVRFNRQIINPAELNTKDAQFSYSISLPPTQRVHEALGYANIEETRDKFNRRHTAALRVNGAEIFNGLFRISSIGPDGYKGNLYLPAPKTVKDIFGAFALNETPEYRIPFSEFAASISAINEAAALGPQMAIFPFALYGLLPKTPLNSAAWTYSARDLWDDSVYIGMQDVPPSLNLMFTLRHIFESRGYSLQGTAFNDAKLTNIYLSYKNAPDYVQPWNYGYHARFQLSGSWNSIVNQKTAEASLENGVNQSQDSGGFAVYSADMLDAVNSAVSVSEDTGGNVLLRDVLGADGEAWTRGTVRIPAAGFYKVTFGASVRVDDRENEAVENAETGVAHISGRSTHADNDFENSTFEIKLLRDRGQADFGLAGAKIDGRFYYDNLPQNDIFDEQNQPKYFPQVGTDQIVLVDAAQNRNLVLGFHFGRSAQGGRVAPGPFQNPRDATNLAPMILAAKPAISWNAQEEAERALLAMPSPGYWKYGRVDVFGDNEDNPNTTIDYSGGTRVTGKVLDSNGNPKTPDTNNLARRFNNYNLDSSTGNIWYFANWETSDFIDLLGFSDLQFSAVVPPIVDVAVVAYYNSAMQYIGFGVESSPGSTLTFTDEPLTPPALARFVRFCGELGTLEITGTDAASGNIILERFPLQRYFTYTLTVPADVTGKVYIHHGAGLSGLAAPVQVVDFVEGVARFETNEFQMADFDPRLTLYLKNPEYDIDGVLIIARSIDVDSDSPVDWAISNWYAQQVINAPTSYAARGQFEGTAGNPAWTGQGEAAAVVWLEAGELLTVASVSAEGRRRRSNQHSTYGMLNHEISWNLSIQPFRTEKDWAKISLQGTGTAPMDWNDAPNFDTDSVNLMGFLSADMQTNDFIDNVVKAFNLQLTQTGENAFSLNVKQSRTSTSSRSIDLDRTASVKQRTNTPLGLPSAYDLGFTVDPGEQGFVESGEDGGGRYLTGAIEGNILEQKSAFSYNWFKDITKGAAVLPLPIISKAEAWNPVAPYSEAMLNRYTDLAYRFWYFDGLLNDLGATFEFNGIDMKLAKVSNSFGAASVLSYKNQRGTILDNYFTILINGSSDYTEILSYITPAQYKELNGSVFVRFNSDMYYLAEITGYDPANRNKATLKLIRRV